MASLPFRLLMAQNRFLRDTTTDEDMFFIDWLRINDPELADEYVANRIALRLHGLIDNEGEMK